MIQAIKRYADWLHLQWPAGKVERLPVVAADGSTNMQGVSIVGDLSGIPLKMAIDTGAKAIDQLQPHNDEAYDVAIIGGGVAGIAAAIAAQEKGLRFTVIEAADIFNTIANFPKGKPIFTYPSDMTPQGSLQVNGTNREELLAELREQAEAADIHHTQAYATHIERKDGQLSVELKDSDPIACHHVVVAIGRSGNFRRLNVPGEELDKVTNRLHDPAAYVGKKVLVVGGGDSAVEAAIAMAELNDGSEALVTLAYRGAELSRPKT